MYNIFKYSLNKAIERIVKVLNILTKQNNTFFMLIDYKYKFCKDFLVYLTMLLLLQLAPLNL